MTKKFALISERADVSLFLQGHAAARETFAFASASAPDLEPSLLETNWQGWEDAGCIFDPAAVPSAAFACLPDACDATGCPDRAAAFHEAGRIPAIVLKTEANR